MCPDQALGNLDKLYAEFGHRVDEYAADSRNTVLCKAGCSHCCRSGGFFAVTAIEALRMNRAVRKLPKALAARVNSAAHTMLKRQCEVFAAVPGAPDEPGQRDEETFSARVSRMTATHPCCPILESDLCAAYAGRPLLCRAYGYAVDAYAVEAGDTKVFRSLCVLYDGVKLHDYVRAKELRSRLDEISGTLTGGRDFGRFTLPEALIANEPA